MTTGTAPLWWRAIFYYDPRRCVDLAVGYHVTTVRAILGEDERQEPGPKLQGIEEANNLQVQITRHCSSLTLVRLQFQNPVHQSTQHVLTYNAHVAEVFLRGSGDWHLTENSCNAFPDQAFRRHRYILAAN